MLTYANVCWRMLTYADVCLHAAFRFAQGVISGIYGILSGKPRTVLITAVCGNNRYRSLFFQIFVRRLLSYKGDLLQENLSKRINVFGRGMSSEISILAQQYDNGKITQMDNVSAVTRMLTYADVC
jgi:hypothetical protein